MNREKKFYKKEELSFSEKLRHRNFRDVDGDRFGRLVVLGYAGKDRYSRWYCECDCGNVVSVNIANLMSGTTKSCGCYGADGSITHGHAKGRVFTKTYRCWTAIIQRCNNKKCSGYPDYGGRGISVCDR